MSFNGNAQTGMSFMELVEELSSDDEEMEEMIHALDGRVYD